MRATTVLTFLLASAGIGCDSATEPATVDDLVGRWNASKYLVRNAASTAQSVDFLNMGMGLSLTFTATTCYKTVFRLDVGEQQTFTGGYTLNEDQLTFLHPINGPETSTVRLYGDGNMLDLITWAEFDFNGDGERDPSTATVTLVKQ